MKGLNFNESKESSKELLQLHPLFMNILSHPKSLEKQRKMIIKRRVENEVTSSDTNTNIQGVFKGLIWGLKFSLVKHLKNGQPLLLRLKLLFHRKPN